MKFFIRNLVVFAITLVTIVSLSSSSLLAATFDPLSNACSGAGSSSGVCQNHTANNAASNNPTTHVISVAANILAVIGGIAGVITIMIGGLNYITSGGNSEAITKGKKRIIGALIGLVIIALAWTIARFGVKLLS